MACTKGQWSKERAWEWYNSQPWIRGYNGYPSNCVNRIAMWQKYNHKEVFDQIAYEFDLAEKTGFNAVRIFRAGYFPPFSSRNRLRMISATELPFCLLSSHDKMSR